MEPTSSAPLVVVVTPVFDGARHLVGCIESVLAQDYDCWRHIVVDNASSDGTADVARRFAERDERIEVWAESEFVPLLSNWNRALTRVPPEARYMKHLSADDRLRPACLRTMVAAAEAHPRVGLVTCGYLYDGRVEPHGGGRKFRLLSGREVARSALVRGVNHLAQPSVLMLRCEAAPDWPNIYPTAGFSPEHPDSPPPSSGDKAGYMDTLESWDVAYVPEILCDMYSTLDEVLEREQEGTPSTTSWSQRVGAFHPGRLEFLLGERERFLSRADASAAILVRALKYLLSLAWRAARGQLRDPEFVRFQRLCLDHVVPRLRREAYGLEARLLGPAAALFRRRDDAATS